LSKTSAPLSGSGGTTVEKQRGARGMSHRGAVPITKHEAIIDSICKFHVTQHVTLFNVVSNSFTSLISSNLAVFSHSM